MPKPCMSFLNACVTRSSVSMPCLTFPSPLRPPGWSRDQADKWEAGSENGRSKRCVQILGIHLKPLPHLFLPPPGARPQLQPAPLNHCRPVLGWTFSAANCTTRTEQSAAPGGTDMVVLRLRSWAPLGPLLSLLFSTSMAVSEETVLENTLVWKALLGKIQWKWSSFFSSVHCYQRKLLHIRWTICKYLNNFLFS